MVDQYFIIIGIIYFILGASLTVGVIKTTTPKIDLEDQDLPLVTVIVAARNEENSIRKCIDSIIDLDYPSEKLDIVIINDHSEDETDVIVRSFQEKNQNLKYLDLTGDESKGFGKANALAEGFKLCSGEFVFQTDADCTVPKSWIQNSLKHFDESVGIVGGMTIVDPKLINRHFDKIQSVDWMYLLGVGGGSIELGVPLSCIGNNLIVRKAAYESVGGYEKIPSTVTEDFAIFQNIVRSGWKAGYTINEESLIYTEPEKTVVDFLRQRARWAAGGVKLAGRGIVLLAAAYLLHLGVLISPFIGASFYHVIFAVFCSFLADYIFLFAIGKKLNKLNLLENFFSFELYFYFSTTFMGMFFPFVTEIIWKGRKLKT